MRPGSILGNKEGRKTPWKIHGFMDIAFFRFAFCFFLAFFPSLFSRNIPCLVVLFCSNSCHCHGGVCVTSTVHIIQIHLSSKNADLQEENTFFLHLCMFFFCFYFFLRFPPSNFQLLLRNIFILKNDFISFWTLFSPSQTFPHFCHFDNFLVNKKCALRITCSQNRKDHVF